MSDREPVTLGEVARWLERHERDSEKTHSELAELAKKLDERTDQLSTRISVIFSVVAVLWAIFLVIAPVIRQWIGL